MTATVGTLAKMGIGTTSTVDQPLEFISENVTKRQQIIDPTGIRGHIDYIAERTRTNGYDVGGQIRMNPAPAELDDIFPYVCGTAKDGSSQFPAAQTISDFYLSIDKVTKVFTFAGVKIGRCTLSAGEGRLLEMALDLVGKTSSTANAGTFPSLTLETGKPYQWFDAVMTIGGNTITMREWELTIENVLRPRKFNSQTVTEIPLMDRVITFRTTVPYNSANEAALLDTGTTGAAVVVTLTNGGFVLTLSMADVEFDTETPVVTGKEEVVLPLFGRARKIGSTAPILITNDSTA